VNYFAGTILDSGYSVELYFRRDLITFMVDIKRTGKSKLKKRIRSVVLIVIGVAAIGGITFGLTRLKPASPTLDRSTAVIDTVKRGQMLREVRGVGTLVPQLVRFVPAPSEGRVEKIPVQAGVVVGADTVIVELSNPKLEQEAMDADFQVKAAEADKESLRTRLESESMTQQSTIASINSQYSQAKLQLDTDEVLGKQGLVPELLLKISRMNVLDLGNRLKVEQQRLAVNAKSVKAQINATESRISQLRASATLKRSQAESL
jgi:HlyD family secretion protein